MSGSAIPGSVVRVAGLLDEVGAERVFLVTGRASFASSGAEEALLPALSARRVVHFRDFSPNPSAEEVERGVALLRREPCQAVVAVGGGSVIDMAKLVNLCAAHEGPTRDYLTGSRRFARAALPLIAVPTTAGAGAEATHFATVYVDGAKHSAGHPSMRPDHAILDPELTATLPPAITASTGIDALAQAIESYWSVGATEASLALAGDAAERAIAHLAPAVRAPTDEHRREMLDAAHLAGRAIDVSRTTAPHALSYAITLGFGVPHGHAVGLTLGAVFPYNARVSESDVGDPRGPGWVRERMAELCGVLGCEEAESARTLLHELMERIGLETRLRKLGVSRGDLPGLVRSVNEERLANNPRVLPAAEVGRILEDVY